MAKRAVCYCKDCQAFARFLKRADTVLDEHGGTAIVATIPKLVHFTQGLEALACMSLSHRGLLRWYASCCNTPIGNTARDVKTPYVGLIESCLQSSSPSLQESFGPVRIVLNTKSAGTREVDALVSNLLALLGVMISVIGARLSGAYKPNPFFATEMGTPVRALANLRRPSESESQMPPDLILLSVGRSNSLVHGSCPVALPPRAGCHLSRSYGGRRITVLSRSRTCALILIAAGTLFLLANLG